MTTVASLLPLDLAPLRGHESLQAQLKASVLASHLPQAILLEGRTGLGKHLVAAQLAAYFWCDEHSACSTCSHCRDISFRRHPEVLWVEPEAGGSLKVADADRIIDHLGACAAGAGAITVAIIAAGVRRVVAAAEDPNPKVRGQGFAKLRQAGISVEIAKEYESRAETLNQPFCHYMRTGRPLASRVKSARANIHRHEPSLWRMRYSASYASLSTRRWASATAW